MLALLALVTMISSDPDTMGPISLSGRGPIVDRLGVQAADGANAVPVPARTPLLGRWIWRNDAGRKAVTTRFRATFDLNSKPTVATLYASAEVSYRLWINGSLVSRGPADPGRDYDTPAPGPWFDDIRNVARFLRQGKNVIAAEVIPDVVVQYEGTTGHPGLKVDLKCTSPDAADQDFHSDETWRSAPAEDLAHHDGPNGFRIDATLAPPGWQAIGFDDASWEPSVEVSQGRKTIESRLAPPLEAIVPNIGAARVSEGVQLKGTLGGAVFTKDGSYAVRYPRVMSARIGLEIEGHRGADLIVMSSEPNAPGANRRAEILLREGLQRIEIPFLNSFSTINIEARGVRSPIEIREVRAIFASYPVQYKGSFECNDPDLNRIWNVCRWVTQICMQTHHLDSPDHQEPICDPGDYLIEALNSEYAFGESALAKQDLRKFARILEQRHYQNFHTSYALLWLQMLMQCVRYTGDDALLEELAPNVHKLLDRFETYIGKNGLISDAPNYMFMDWVQIAGFNAHHPPAVIGQGYMTALYYRALADDAQIAEQMHDRARSDHDRQVRAHIKTAFDRELWSPAEQLYRDGKPNQTDVPPNQWLPADKDVETFSTQVNTLAVCAGLAEPARAAAVMRKLLARPDMNCQPYFMHFVFEALERSGLFDAYAVAQIHRWKILPDTQSFFEMWDQGDRSHAWNATPLYQMSGHVLGVQPELDGFRKFSVEPHAAGLRWARGKVPTPYGNIEVSWKREADSLILSVNVPPGTEALIGGKNYPAGHHSGIRQKA